MNDYRALAAEAKKMQEQLRNGTYVEPLPKGLKDLKDMMEAEILPELQSFLKVIHDFKMEGEVHPPILKDGEMVIQLLVKDARGESFNLTVHGTHLGDVVFNTNGQELLGSERTPHRNVVGMKLADIMASLHFPED